MSGFSDRPSYVSYLPPAYVDQPDGFLACFVSLFETLMAGTSPVPERLLESWIPLDALPEFFGSEVSGDGDLRYDPQSQRLIFFGSMSLDRYEELRDLPPSDWVSFETYRRTLDHHFHHPGEALSGLDQILDGIDRYSDPLAAPSPVTDVLREPGFFDDDFLPYLAGWVDLALRQHWPETKRRRLIQNIVPLYKTRGTLNGITRLLELFVEAPKNETRVRVTEELGIQVGERATVGVDTTVGGLPLSFNVTISYGSRDAGDPRRPFDMNFVKFLTQDVKQVLDFEKPAHTDYQARLDFPGIIVGKYSTVQWDTLIWSGERRG